MKTPCDIQQAREQPQTPHGFILPVDPVDPGDRCDSVGPTSGDIADFHTRTSGLDQASAESVGQATDASCHTGAQLREVPTSVITGTRDPAAVPRRDAVRISVDMDSPGLLLSLLTSFWKYQKLFVSTVHSKRFLEHREQNLRSQYYSKFLESAIFAFSSRSSTSAAVRGLSVEYSKRAKFFLDAELSCPNLATLTGLLLLADYEVCNLCTRLGWIYCGACPHHELTWFPTEDFRYCLPCGS